MRLQMNARGHREYVANTLPNNVNDNTHALQNHKLFSPPQQLLMFQKIYILISFLYCPIQSTILDYNVDLQA